jgi:hypothetical protein
MPAAIAPRDLAPAESFDIHDFMKGFVAGLVLKNRLSLRPQSPSDRRGFAKVVRKLDQKIDEFEHEKKNPELVDQLVQIANELRSSNTGGYEGFETALRSLQLTFASCPNPFYEEIAFSVPIPYAESTVESLPAPQRDLVKELVAEFLQEAGT